MFSKVAGVDVDEVLHEFFFDSDSGEEFLGFDRDEVEVERVCEAMRVTGELEDNDSSVLSVSSTRNPQSDRALNGYDHTWLRNFGPDSGPIKVQDDFSEADVFRLFITDEVIQLFVRK